MLAALERPRRRFEMHTKALFVESRGERGRFRAAFSITAGGGKNLATMYEELSNGSDLRNSGPSPYSLSLHGTAPCPDDHFRSRLRRLTMPREHFRLD